MPHIQHTLDIKAPLDAVYRQWTQFESFPYFMQTVKSVQRLSDIRMIWLGEIGGDEREWYTEVTEMVPNQLIAWHHTSGPRHNVVVRFFYIDHDSMRLDFQADFAVPDITDDLQSAAEAYRQQIVDSLERFRIYIEDNNYSADLWRYEVERAVQDLWDDKPPAPKRDPIEVRSLRRLNKPPGLLPDDKSGSSD